jgi:hypothetical protein
MGLQPRPQPHVNRLQLQPKFRSFLVRFDWVVVFFQLVQLDPQRLSKTRFQSPYGPQLAVSSSHRRFLRGLGYRHLKLRLNDKAYGAVKTLVSDRRVAPTTPPPAVSTRDSPRFQAPTCSKTCVESPDGPKKTVPSIHPRFRHLDGLRMGRGTTVHEDDTVDRRPVDRENNTHHKDVRVESANASTRCRGRRGGRVCSGNGCCYTFVCEQQDALDALASSSDPQNLSNNKVCCLQKKSVVQTNYAPGSQQPTNSKVRYDPSRSLQTAAPLQPIEQLHFH